MRKILLISDTHSYLDPRINKHIDACDEVWHAGDIGNIELTDGIKLKKPLIAVYGNIDDNKARAEFKRDEIFTCEGVKVFITHIGGYPPNYTAVLLQRIKDEKPQLFICGHSHILKVMYDEKLSCLHMNPGAIGTHGFHKVQTALKFEIEKGKIQNLQIIELTRLSDNISM
ncbi:MAG: metallophosphoesterase family protein [Bacteroidetes bacterium]|nr:metallophosphoesterase family protein [Bacteroidota bacterium]